MKKKLACTIAAVAFVLSACGSSSNEPELDDLQRDLLDTAIEDTPSLQGKSDAEVLDIFESVCSTFESSKADGGMIALRDLLDQGFPAGEAGGMLVYSAAVSCQDEMATARMGS